MTEGRDVIKTLKFLGGFSEFVVKQLFEIWDTVHLEDATRNWALEGSSKIWKEKRLIAIEYWTNGIR